LFRAICVLVFVAPLFMAAVLQWWLYLGRRPIGGATAVGARRVGGRRRHPGDAQTRPAAVLLVLYFWVEVLSRGGAGGSAGRAGVGGEGCDGDGCAAALVAAHR
jgi:hypothetical protein